MYTDRRFVKATTRPLRFLHIALAILGCALLIHIIFNFENYASVSDYPYDEIFYHDSVTVSRGSNSVELVPVGITVGVRFYTEGIMVLATDKVTAPCGKQSNPSCDKLLVGDVLIGINGAKLVDLPQLMQAVEGATGTVALEVQRGNGQLTIEVAPAINEAGEQKIGCWVRDSTQGIGTITYYNPQTGGFAALGHGIMDVDTQKLMSVRHGQIMESCILDVRKGKKGTPGEMIGEIREDNIIGTIRKNTPLGIYGEINAANPILPTTKHTAARHDQIRQGPAKILSNIEGDDLTPKLYDVYIESVNQDPEADKGLVVRITDQGLISRSGGIVQGMSGSPILQNGRIVGAITQVTVRCYHVLESPKLRALWVCQILLFYVYTYSS